MKERETKRPTVVLVTGGPATGKTTITDRCAEEFGLPTLSRDKLKETLFDTLGWSNRAWSQKVGEASYKLLFYCLEMMLTAKVSVIVDSNFSTDYGRETIRELIARHNYRTIELICWAPPSVIIDRFARRASSGERHPGHQDAGNINEFAAKAEEHPSIPIITNSESFFIDTTASDTSTLAIKSLRKLLVGGL